jgi:putative ABC transport system permease protein
MLREILAVVLMNLRSIPQRMTASAVAVVGVAAAVAVLVTVLGMAQGFRQMVASTGRADRAIVLATAAFSESSSLLPRDTVTALSDIPGVRIGADGKPMVSAEAVLVASLQRASDQKLTQVTLRGISFDALDVRPEIRIADGRMFRPAVHEIIVGDLARNEFGLATGSRIELDGVHWTVVGFFKASGGGSLSSELISDATTVMAAYRRNQFQSLTAQLQSPEAFAQFSDAVAINPVVSVTVKRESDYYAEQSKAFATLLEYIAYGVGGLMGLGAAFGAVNTMYSAIKVRTREIAVLRALGFRGSAIAASVLSEAVLLAWVGSLIGTLASWLLFRNATASTAAGSGTQLIFTFELSASAIQLGVAGACVIGVLGALLPTITALRSPVAPALTQ